MANSKDDERREYFRVDDSVRLRIRPVAEDHLKECVERLQADVGGFGVMAGLAGITAEMAASMRRIENSDPDVAAYLKALDRKIDVLGRAFIARDSDLMDVPAHPVNLSAGGMGVLVNEAYPVDSFVEISMLLFPSFTGVMLYGKVIACQPLPPEEQHEGFSHAMRVEFVFLREQERDILIRHVLRCQGMSLRRND